MTATLTPKQQAILRFIEDFQSDEGGMPSLREIGKHFGVSVGTVQDQVDALRRKGFLDRHPDRRSRGLRLPNPFGQIPILGRVFAGTLHAAFPEVEGHVAVGNEYRKGDHFALRVRGDSMIGAGINEDDLVLVRRQAVANEGDIVVALAGDETTVKRLRWRGGKPVLVPENPRYSEIEGPFDILGVVVELRRRLE